MRGPARHVFSGRSRASRGKRRPMRGGPLRVLVVAEDIDLAHAVEHVVREEEDLFEHVRRSTRPWRAPRHCPRRRLRRARRGRRRCARALPSPSERCGRTSSCTRIVSPRDLERGGEALSLGAAGVIVSPPTGDALARVLADVKAEAVRGKQVNLLEEKLSRERKKLETYDRLVRFARGAAQSDAVRAIVDGVSQISGAQGVALYATFGDAESERVRLAAVGTALDLPADLAAGRPLAPRASAPSARGPARDWRWRARHPRARPRAGRHRRGDRQRRRSRCRDALARRPARTCGRERASLSATALSHGRRAHAHPRVASRSPRERSRDHAARRRPTEPPRRGDARDRRHRSQHGRAVRDRGRRPPRLPPRDHGHRRARVPPSHPRAPHRRAPRAIEGRGRARAGAAQQGRRRRHRRRDVPSRRRDAQAPHQGCAYACLRRQPLAGPHARPRGDVAPGGRRRAHRATHARRRTSLSVSARRRGLGALRARRRELAARRCAAERPA